jgi:SAM-dependent methyltransferase
VSTTLPTPPPELAARIGGAYEEYDSISAAHRRYIDSLLPEDWTLDGKAVLDFGCGTGRTLTAYASETDRAKFWGCDIHAESIAWAQQNLSPPFQFFTCMETPPLDQPAERFDLVYAMSVFTHITDEWSAWLLELHRVMRSDALAIISVLGPGMAPTILGHDWDERIGMAVVDLHKDWDVGGPDVLLSEWWIRSHWGRAFEILQLVPPSAGDGRLHAGHDLVVMRKRDIAVTREELEEIAPDDAREQAAILCNLELVKSQLVDVGAQLRVSRREHTEVATQATAQLAQLGEERDRLLRELNRLETSRSWRVTAPARRAAAAVRRGRSV